MFNPFAETTNPDPPDEELVRQATTGDRDALERLIRRHQGWVYNIDADLAILGASEPAYRIYAEQIRQEFAWVPEPEYRMGRQQILECFLTRPRIYHFLSHLEATARRNIAAEIAQLADT